MNIWKTNGRGAVRFWKGTQLYRCYIHGATDNEKKERTFHSI